jgi:hypothetical protein
LNLFVAKIVNICDKNKKHYLQLRRQKTIISDEDYHKASKRLIEIFNAIPYSKEDKELTELIALIKAYDEKQFTN